MPNISLNNLITAYGSRPYDVDAALIKAVMKKESNFVPSAYRWEDHLKEASYGLMQTLESTARALGFVGPVIGLFDPVVSINFGTKYLRDLLRKFNGNIKDTLSAYNAGSGNVRPGSPYVNPEYVNSAYRYYQFYSLQKMIINAIPLVGVLLLGYFVVNKNNGGD